ncbi:MAG TPA: hypothetical protein VHA54_08920 [Solirubrobacterales bacterium]|nr:hypothetical protein [Solirubrobacterales bacterium]
MRRTDGIVVAICALALAALALAGPAHATTYGNGFQVARFKVEVKGVQTTVQQHTKEAVDECDTDDHSSGSERVVFATTKPIVITATYMPGQENPEFFAGRQLGIPTKAKVKRSWTSRISQSRACEDNGGGVENATKLDCGTKTVQPYVVKLQYSRERKSGLLLSGSGEGDPFQECPGAATMGFPWLLVEGNGSGNYILADLSQKELFDPKFQKWISIAEGERKSTSATYWMKTHVRWEVSFTRLESKS